MTRSSLFDALRGAAFGLLTYTSPPDDLTPLEWLSSQVEVADLRQTPKAGRAARARSKGTRSKTEGVCVHQTAGPVRNWANVPCHIGIDRDGRVSLVHSLDAYLYAAHALNRRSVSVEIECRAAGIEGVDRTFWRRASEKEKGETMDALAYEANEKQLRALQLVLFYLAQVYGALKLWAHRQSHKSRVSDPGSRIYAAMEAAAAVNSKLMTAPDDVFGSGTVIPRQWRADGKGGPYAWWDKG